MVRHTPGPWRALGDGLVVVSSGKDRTVADVYAPGVSFSAETGDEEYNAVVDANSILIATAPELLSACEIALSFTRNIHVLDQNSSAFKELAKQVEDVLSNAISKALHVR